MLQIHSVNPTGMGPYGNHPTISLDNQGLVWLTGNNLDKGGSNGSGKSWLMNCIAVILFGKGETQTGTETLKDEAINNVWGKGCCGRVVFTNSRQQTWRVTFSRKWKQDPPYENDSELYPYHGSDIYLERLDDPVGPVWVDERGSEMAKTQAKLREVVGMSYEQYLTTTYLAQGKGKEFLKGTNATRMSIMTDVTNIHVWDQAEVLFKQEVVKLEKEYHDLELQIAQIAGKISEIQLLTTEELQHFSDEKLMLVKDIVELEAKRAALAVEKAEKLEQISSLSITKDPYEMQLWEVSQEISKLNSDVDAKLAAAVQPISNLELKLKEKAFCQAEHAFQSAVDGHCHSCGQPIPLETIKQLDAAAEFAMREFELEQRRYVARLLDADVRDEENKKYITHQCNYARQELLSRLDSLTKHREEFLASIESTKTEKKTLEEEVSVIDLHLQSLALNVKNNEWRIKIINDKLLVHGESEKRKLELVNLTLQLSEKLKNTKLNLTEWQWLAKNTKSLKSHKIVSATERLNELLAESMLELDGSFTVWCKPWRPKPQALKKAESDWTADDVVVDFTIFVQEKGKESVPLSLYSGGEVSIIALAFLISFWRLSDEMGSGTNLLLLDEIFGFLDDRNSQLVASFLESLKTSGKTVLVVSHSQVVDAVGFDQKWVVTKQNDMSQVKAA